MHKLVYAWGQERLKIEQQRRLSLIALELLFDILSSRTCNSIFGMRLVPHVMANFTVISDTNMTSETIGKSLESVAVMRQFIHSLGRWSDEYKIQAFHLGKIREVTGAEHPSTLMSMSNLAGVLNNQGKYKQAEEMYRQVLRLREKD